jgi:hypothetical protein
MRATTAAMRSLSTMIMSSRQLPICLMPRVPLEIIPSSVEKAQPFTSIERHRRTSGRRGADLPARAYD